MSEKMKKQQEEARQRAAHQQRDATEQKVKPKPAASTRRETRNKAIEEPAAGDGATEDELALGRRRARPRKSGPKGSTISSYFQKADVKVDEDNPTVKEALEKAAEDYEANPTALGEQELVATQQPSLVTGGKMRTYQLEGLEWMKTLWMNGLCGILADEMGLGKTVQAISMIAFLKENNVAGPYLITAPLSTLSNWIDEFKRWTPGIETVLYHGTKEERTAIRNKCMKTRDQGKMNFPIVCTSYDICINDSKFLGQYQWRYIVVVC
jgi:ATP-dependent DNA helicase